MAWSLLRSIWPANLALIKYLSCFGNTHTDVHNPVSSLCVKAVCVRHPTKPLFLTLPHLIIVCQTCQRGSRDSGGTAGWGNPVVSEFFVRSSYERHARDRVCLFSLLIEVAKFDLDEMNNTIFKGYTSVNASHHDDYHRNILTWSRHAQPSRRTTQEERRERLVNRVNLAFFVAAWQGLEGVQWARIGRRFVTQGVLVVISPPEGQRAAHRVNSHSVVYLAI